REHKTEKSFFQRYIAPLPPPPTGTPPPRRRRMEIVVQNGTFLIKNRRAHIAEVRVTVYIHRDFSYKKGKNYAPAGGRTLYKKGGGKCFLNVRLINAKIDAIPISPKYFDKFFYHSLQSDTYIIIIQQITKTFKLWN
ncbi:MAG: hypothetical protein LUE99_13570, partial [Bacteroides sp.]|nr:hypothetical protein [Bacteroides sp.]